MNIMIRLAGVAGAMLAICSAAEANSYREKGKQVAVAGSTVKVTPPRDWNELTARPGKHAETWTLDGDQLNDVTFFIGIASGEPLVRERNRKREPLPKFTRATLLIEVPELLEATYRAAKQIGAFTLTSSKLDRFLDHEGVRFTYEFIDSDELPRKGEAFAAWIDGKLYMATFDAPRVHFFDRTVGDYRALVDTAHIGP